MKILNIEHPYFTEAFRNMGHDVFEVRLSPGGGQPVFYKQLLASLLAKGFSPDLVLWCDGGNLPYVFGWEAMPAVVIGLSIDSFCNPWHVPFSAAYDHLFVAQKDFVSPFTVDPFPRRVEWLPLFCQQGDSLGLGLARDIPVSFVGTLAPANIPARRPFLVDFRRRCPLYTKQGPYREVFNRSQLVLNQSAVGEINFRLFEASACGAAVLTEDVEHGLRELYVPGEEALLYPRGDAAAAAAIARDWLSRPDDLARVARAGRRRTVREHTNVARARRILSTAESLRASGAPKWRLRNLPVVHAEMAKGLAFIAAELDLGRYGELRRFYQDISSHYVASWDDLGVS